MQRKTTDDFLDQDIDSVLNAFATDVDAGHSPEEAARRLAQYSPNEIEGREEPLWHRLFRRFWGPIPWMIEVAALLSALVQEWEDFVIILIMLLVNAGLDFFQEHRALNALQTLKARLANEAIVLRARRFLTLPVQELVPGDIVKLRIGDIIPADCKLVQGDYLWIDQAAFPVSRYPWTASPGRSPMPTPSSSRARCGRWWPTPGRTPPSPA
jgi:H+-transporting ATPase